jgi:hypothetical protein
MCPKPLSDNNFEKKLLTNIKAKKRKSGGGRCHVLQTLLP